MKTEMSAVDVSSQMGIWGSRYWSAISERLIGGSAHVVSTKTSDCESNEVGLFKSFTND
jgi:hypothetical protein